MHAPPTHAPVVPKQLVGGVLQTSCVPTHTPPVHESPVVHALPSLQLPVICMYEHVPASARHTPTPFDAKHCGSPPGDVHATSPVFSQPPSTTQQAPLMA